MAFMPMMMMGGPVEDDSSTLLLLGLLGIGAVAGGVVLWVWWKNKKKEEEDDDDDSKSPGTAGGTGSSSSSAGASGSGNAGAGSTTPAAPADYILFKQSDSPGNDIKQVSPFSEEVARTQCTADPKCVVFNSDGFLKSKLEGSDKWTHDVGRNMWVNRSRVKLSAAPPAPAEQYPNILAALASLFF